MKLLYTPLRAKYHKKRHTQKSVASEPSQSSKSCSSIGSNNSTNSKPCVFCEKLKLSNDKDNLILKRFKFCVVMLNLYPYNAGHLLIVPYDHAANLYLLSQEVQAEIMHASSKSMEIIKKALNSHGINIGMNTGDASGGSIPEHLHMHIVPRYKGDTNFLSAISQVKPMAKSPQEVYDSLIHYFTDITL